MTKEQIEQKALVEMVEELRFNLSGVNEMIEHNNAYGFRSFSEREKKLWDKLLSTRVELIEAKNRLKTYEDAITQCAYNNDDTCNLCGEVLGKHDKNCIVVEIELARTALEGKRKDHE